jgi:hypothetical protein
MHFLLMKHHFTAACVPLLAPLPTAQVLHHRKLLEAQTFWNNREFIGTRVNHAVKQVNDPVEPIGSMINTATYPAKWLHFNAFKDEAINTVSRKWIEAMQALWLATADRGLCASLYAASDVTAKVGDGTQVTIREETDDPFGETITFTLSMKNAVEFPLHLRLPRWCDSPQVAII